MRGTIPLPAMNTQKQVKQTQLQNDRLEKNFWTNKTITIPLLDEACQCGHGI